MRTDLEDNCVCAVDEYNALEEILNLKTNSRILKRIKDKDNRIPIDLIYTQLSTCFQTNVESNNNNDVR